VTKFGIAYSNTQDAFQAGTYIAETALQAVGITRPDLAIAFCAGTMDHEQFFKGLQAHLGPHIPIIGGSSIGIITNNEISYKGFPAAAALIQSDTMEFMVKAVGGLDKDEFSAGQELIRALPRSEEEKFLLAFYDSVRIPANENVPPVLNSSSPLIAGMESVQQRNLPLIGAGLIGDYAFGPTRQFCGSFVADQHAVACLVSGRVSVYYAIMHGCVPLDGIYRRITRIQGSVLYELDGKPIVPLINELYGSTDWQSQRPVNFLTIGVNHGERYGPPQESSFVNRLITGVTPDGAGIGMFEPDLAPGLEIQFMIRDNRMMISSARENTIRLLEKIEHDKKRPLFAFYIDCAGRTAELSYTEREEAAEVQNMLNRHTIPLLGFYSGVEIAPLFGQSRGLDWTGVLMVVAESD
jgi:hypothetical protein